MYISKDAAQKRAEAARSRLEAAQKRAEAAQKRAEVAAQKQAIWQIWGFFAEHTPAAWGAFWYFLISSSGAIYSLVLYQQFEINIFNFFDTSDFLLSAFRTPTTLIIGIIATLLVIFILGYLAYNSIIYRSIDRTEQQSLVHREARILLRISILLGLLAISVSITAILNFSKYDWTVLSLLGLGVILIIPISVLVLHFRRKLTSAPISRTAQTPPSRREAGILLAVLLGVFIVIVPYLLGWYDSEKRLEDESRHVRVTIRLDADRPKIRLPYPALLLGTTSDFHFFYKCIQKNERDWKCRGEDKIENERVFIVPTANLSSLEFISEPEEPPAQFGPAEVVAAIDKINKTITALNTAGKRNTSKVVKAIGEIELDPIIEIFPEIELDPTIKISPEIGLDLPKVAQAIDKLTAAIVASEFYPDPIIVALRATIAELNATIRNINISGVVNSCAFGGELLGTVQPFQKGKHELEANEYRKLSAVFDKMEPHFEDNTLHQLILIGRLSGEERRFSDARRELAQARAKWVKKKILERFPELEKVASRIILRLLPPEDSLLRMSTDQGPYYDYNPLIYDLPRTGSVGVYACWAPGPE